MPPEVPVVRKNVVTVDEMVELQSLDKPTIITTCVHLAKDFTEQVHKKYSESDKFTCYPTDMTFLFLLSLLPEYKGYYRITDSTHIAKVTIKSLFLTKTQDGIDQVSISHVDPTERRATSVVVAWGDNCQATHQDVTQLIKKQAGRGGHEDDPSRC